MKNRKIGTAIDNLRQALEEKFGKKTEAQIIIKAEHVSLDDPYGKALCSETGTQRVADALELPTTPRS